MNFLQKKTIIWIVATVLVSGFVFSSNKLIENTGQEKNITFVSGSDNKVWYIKSKDCSSEIYADISIHKGTFEGMCKAYTTDGEFVYYDGIREVVIPTVINSAPMIVNGRVASSSLPSQPKEDLFVIDGADPETFEIISSDYLDSSLVFEKNPTLTYSRDKNHVYREGKLVEGVDPDTLTIIGKGYVKDKNSVFCQGKKIEGSDPDSFEFLENGYARDKNFVYLYSLCKPIGGSDGATFEILSDDYAKDSINVYYKKNKLEGADAKTFKLVFGNSSGYSIDQNTAYYEGKRMEGTDPGTFEQIKEGSGYVKDKNFVYSYYLAEKLPNIDAKTFEHISSSYFKDKNSVYLYKDKQIMGADPESFEVLGGSYVKDKNFVWRANYASEGGEVRDAVVIEGADPITFEFLEIGYAKDKNFVYFGSEKTLDADVNTFVVVDYNYSKDKQAMYYKGKLLANVNPDFFEVLRCGFIKDNLNVFFVRQNGESVILDGADVASFKIIENTCYAKDKESVFFNNSGYRFESFGKIEGADPETFEVISGGYTKDATKVYYNGVNIKGSDVDTFELVGFYHSKDKNFVYYQGLLIDGADPKTFETTSASYYSKDLKSAYYKGVEIPGVDIETFEISKINQSAKDKNTSYVNGVPVITDDSMIGLPFRFRMGESNVDIMYPIGI